MRIRTSLSHDALRSTIAEVSETFYDSNLNIEALDRQTRTNAQGQATFRLKLGTHDSHGVGSRRSASGRHGKYASWHAFRDVFAAIFLADPEATISTGMATYKGARGFLDEFPATAERNVGSMMAPAYMDELSVDGFEGTDFYVKQLERFAYRS